MMFSDYIYTICIEEFEKYLPNINDFSIFFINKIKKYYSKAS